MSTIQPAATPSSGKKRKDLTLLEKVEALNIISQGGKSHRDVAQMFGVGRSQISSLVKRRNEVFASINSNDISIHRKRIHSSTGKHSDINDYVYNWYKETRARGKTVTGPELQKKALEISRNIFGNEEFKASNGWLGSFQTRHNVRFGRHANENSRNEHTNSDSNDSNPSAIGNMYIHDQDAMEMYINEHYAEEGNTSRNNMSFSVPDPNRTESSMMQIKTEPDHFEYYYETLPVHTQKHLNPYAEHSSTNASRKSNTCTCSCKEHKNAEERNHTFRMKYLNYLKTTLKNTIEGLEELGAEVVTWIVIPTEDNCSQIFHLGTNRGIEFINTKPTIDAELHSFLKNGDTCMREETSYEESNTRSLDSSTPITLGPQIEGTKQELVERCIQIIDKAYRAVVSKDQMFPYQLLKHRQKAWFNLSGFPEELLPLRHPLEYETSGLKKIILNQDKIKFHILHKKLQEAYYKKPPCTSTVKSSLLQKVNPNVSNMEIVSDVLNMFNVQTEMNKAKENPNESMSVINKDVPSDRTPNAEDVQNTGCKNSSEEVENGKCPVVEDIEGKKTPTNLVVRDLEGDTTYIVGIVPERSSSPVDVEDCENSTLDVENSRSSPIDAENCKNATADVENRSSPSDVENSRSSPIGVESGTNCTLRAPNSTPAEVRDVPRSTCLLDDSVQDDTLTVHIKEEYLDENTATDLSIKRAAFDGNGPDVDNPHKRQKLTQAPNSSSVSENLNQDMPRSYFP